jgi:hypothetical protein
MVWDRICDLSDGNDSLLQHRSQQPALRKKC